jgi:2-polyprenyl-3-methyl-5-hydroxy-6-metoxy-1,4-benzoquinol methylase
VSELLALQETLYSSRNPTRRWLHRTRLARIERALRQAATQGPSGRALEVGPGSGVYLPILAELFDEVVAADVEDAFLEHARRIAASHPNVTAVEDDITDTGLAPASFDLVLCSEVVEHIRESQCALAGIHRLLRPGGLLVLSTPQRHSPLELAGRVAFLPGVIGLVRLIYREPILPTGHVNLLTEAEARTQMEAAGFRIVEAWKTGVYVPLLAELAGQTGLRLEKWLERRIAGGRLDWLLWTQYYLGRA